MTARPCDLELHGSFSDTRRACRHRKITVVVVRFTMTNLQSPQLALLLVLSLSISCANAFVPAPRNVNRQLSKCPSLVASNDVRKVSFTTLPPQLKNSRPLSLSANTEGSKIDKELVSITSVSDDKYDALSDYIVQWSKLLQDDGKSYSLTTPVTVTASDATPSDDVEQVSGVKILFQKTQTGARYKSKEEERAIEEGEEEDNTPEKDVKEGGVEVLVEQLKDGSVQVRARRCEVEEDTTIKEMSEETITKELTKAVDVFNKQ